MIPLREIPPEGLHREYDLSGEFASRALEGTEADAVASAVTATLDLSRAGIEVLARGTLSGVVAVVCSRCAGAARIAVESRMETVFLPRGAEPEAAAGDDELVEQPDVAYYDHDEIDLAETLREELLLSLPIAPLCAEACRGLCARCGKDLNEGPCDCPEQPRDDRWSALRNLKLE